MFKNKLLFKLLEYLSLFLFFSFFNSSCEVTKLLLLPVNNTKDLVVLSVKNAFTYIILQRY